MAATTTSVCPECGSTTPVVEGFKRWCDQCNWNVEPYSRDDDNFFARQYARIGKRSGARTLRNLATTPLDALRPRLTISKAIAYGLAIVVHASSLMTFAAGAYFVIGYYPSIPAIALGLALCGLAWLLLPALGKVPENVVPESDFPALYSFVNNVARDLGGQPIRHIVVDETYNAAYGTVGCQREAVLWIGLPLWIALAPQERVAVVGHEVAHGVNGDSTRGLVIGSAVHTLDAWIALLRADHDAFSRIGTWLLSLPVSAFQIVLAHLLWRDSQRAEFLADYLGAAISGTPATISALTKVSLSEHFNDFLLRRIYSTSQSGQDLFDEFRKRIANLPEREMERVRRAANLEGSRLDSTHPPTAQRIAFLSAHQVDVPRLVADEAVMSRIDGELHNPGGAAGKPPHRQVCS